MNIDIDKYIEYCQRENPAITKEEILYFILEDSMNCFDVRWKQKVKEILREEYEYTEEDET